MSHSMVAFLGANAVKNLTYEEKYVIFYRDLYISMNYFGQSKIT